MLKLEITTPEREMFSGEVDSISLPTPDGEITILPHHIPLISIVVPGSIMVRQGREEQFFAVSRGLVEIDGKNVHILVDTADRAEELQEEAIEKARVEAVKLQRERRGDAEGFAEATAILDRELAKLKVVRRRRTGRSRPPTSSPND
jgi:F-type H+-transporting ATPase subunit epsilon